MPDTNVPTPETKRNDGGPAFPNKPPTYGEVGAGGAPPQFPGMTLRDYFAGQALAGAMAHTALLERIVPKNVGNELADQYVAAHCFAVADAMIRERAK